MFLLLKLRHFQIITRISLNIRRDADFTYLVVMGSLRPQERIMLNPLFLLPKSQSKTTTEQPPQHIKQTRNCAKKMRSEAESL